MCEERFKLDDFNNIDELNRNDVSIRNFDLDKEHDRELICDKLNELYSEAQQIEQELQDYKDAVGSWFIEHNYLFKEDEVYSIENELGIELDYYVEDDKPQIKYEPVNTHNENNDRFVLTVYPNNGVTIYDNFHRDGYGLYAGDGRVRFSEGKVSVKNFQYLTDRLNEFYNENQLLKNNDKGYHKLVIDKISKEMEYYLESWKRALDNDNKKLADFYLEVYKELGEVKDYTIQGLEYE